ncbi:hypothetical protein HQ325_16945 [Rhodococcus sp. BP-349]|uniref:hypothetical protein n=1 Tax=unclassified Rhodococcus (in: high G+C Gram-positive bacteria) TaxID=192944 RepID=UPI001C9A9A58|nr:MULTISPECIES: hypothetical protein [unclassified Rhodococcus (in: high G+C Gram-positive bacteria)]MBY6540364.1 hypothetical protein [Rhodococcus sp. BP-363]MBY6545611.1 hypothetical protein [Rhodococcus sp. BP-369]MBY6564841.1 hypothetical protein [Rhodococcus sp. BP-370]MBY6578223.1 hypothetical protein [Rhodococcus sp. BP-364]MBY6587524.1 hypothetical protein [Rhodococcus sp. BP-358]
MTTVFMLDDEEWWPDDPEPGALCSPTTYWADASEIGLPREVVSEVAASIVTVRVERGIERVAHLGDGFTTMLSAGDTPVGEAVLTGALVWDRYLWTDFRTPTTGRVRVLNFVGYVVQQVTRHPTVHSGWRVPEPHGPLEYLPAGTIESGVSVKWRVWQVEVAP